MATATLFIRTVATKNTTLAVLKSTFPDQVLEFNTPDKILEGNTRDHQNNIVAKPSPTNDGSKIIKIIPNGLKDLNLSNIQGHVKISNDDAYKKIINFPIIPQFIDPEFPFGRFGLDYPNATRHGIDPKTATNATEGLTIKSLTSVHNAKAKIIEFTLNLQWGGTLVAEPPYNAAPYI